MKVAVKWRVSPSRCARRSIRSSSPDAFYHDIGVALLLAAISASAWNIVGGYAGQVSVGHGMFFGIGAYVPLLVYQHGGWPPVAGVPVGIVLSVVLAVVDRHADVPPARAIISAWRRSRSPN